MRKKIVLAAVIVISLCIVIGCQFTQVMMASKNEFFLAYPPDRQETTSSSIFFLGVASSADPIYLNDKSINKTQKGYFAAKVPLILGPNKFKLKNQGQEKLVTVMRNRDQPEIPKDALFLVESLFPQVNVEIPFNELICFKAIAPEGAKIVAKVNKKTIPLFWQANIKPLAANNSVLIDSSQPPASDSMTGSYRGCTNFAENEITQPTEITYELTFQGKKITQKSPGKLTITNSKSLQVIEISADQAITRTGPSTDYSRLTPLPKGTRATVTTKQGDWLRLDYGAWLKKDETKIIKNATPVNSIIKGVYSNRIPGGTEILFPLETPVPFSVKEDDRKFILTLYNTTAQTDIIRSDYDSFLKRIEWSQISPGTIEYIFRLNSKEQAGYSLKYEGNNLLLSLRHPVEPEQPNTLKGITILLDPGHGGKDTGATGPDGRHEKDLTLTVANLLKQELLDLGANVQLTRSSDIYVSLEERVKLIEQIQPNISISLHYNSLPDGGDPVKTMGVSSYWYHPQAEDLASFLENNIVRELKRKSYGVYWDNLALTRPTIAPSILLELGFLSNPEEFEWITNQQEQRKLARSIAHAIQDWFEQN